MLQKGSLTVEFAGWETFQFGDGSSASVKVYVRAGLSPRFESLGLPEFVSKFLPEVSEALRQCPLLAAALSQVTLKSHVISVIHVHGWAEELRIRMLVLMPLNVIPGMMKRIT